MFIANTNVLILALVLLFSGFGCSFFKSLPDPSSTKQRLANFSFKPDGLRAGAELYWSEQQLPYIHVESDEDLPYLIGMVHAHLRLGQMEILKRVSQARVSELFGPFVADIDHTLRILDPDKAVGEMEQQLPSRTKEWIERYVEGLNEYKRRAPREPFEFELFEMASEPWTVRDVLSISRLAGTDINWLFWSQLLRLERGPKWEELRKRLKSYGYASIPSMESPQEIAQQLLAIRTGSNSVVVSGSKRKGRAALIASDPHVGINLPNLWVLIGFKSPSYQSVGISIAGLPVVLIGRNRDIAWGATNMMALSSSFYRLSAEDLSKSKRRSETIKQRLWFDREITIRESAYGPVISDAPFFEGKGLPDLAIRWQGHEASDELSGFLGLLSARNWEDFRQSFESYAVSGQNYLYADRDGNIGQVMAVKYEPAIGRVAEGIVGDPSNPDHLWGEGVGSLDLPRAYNPKDGFLVSANNVPAKMDPPVTWFAYSNDRVRRAREVLERSELIDVEKLKRLQGDSYAFESHEIAKKMVEMIEADSFEVPGSRPLIEALREWNDSYERDSVGAVAFQVVLHHFVKQYYGTRYGPELADYVLSSQAAYHLVLRDLGQLGTQAPLRAAITQATTSFEPSQNWGKIHRLSLQSWFGSIPLVGKKFRFEDRGVSGSTSTFYKSAHKISPGEHQVRYGANARHVSDLEDLDENYFVLLGGQDGWFGSENFLDQAEAFFSGDYIRFPLRLSTVREVFPHHRVLREFEQ